MNIAANIIAFLHLLFIIFVATTPFATDNPFFLLYYSFILFFVMLHWYLNNDTCILTVIESKLRGTRDTQTFMGRLLKPIYNVQSNEIKYVTLSLFLFALIKTRLWEKERYDDVYTTLYINYKLLYNTYNNKYNVTDSEVMKLYNSSIFDLYNYIYPLKDTNSNESNETIINHKEIKIESV